MLEIKNLKDKIEYRAMKMKRFKRGGNTGDVQLEEEQSSSESDE